MYVCVCVRCGLFVVISNIISDMMIKCTEDGKCPWVGKVSELYQHREACTLCPLITQSIQSAKQMDVLRSSENDDSEPARGDWFHLSLSLFLAAFAGRYVAQRLIVRMWAMMVLSFLTLLEPNSAMPVWTSLLYFSCDFMYSYSAAFSTVVIGWIFVVTPSSATIQISTQRPIPPHLIVTLGDVNYAMFAFYNIALTVLAGAVGYYHAMGDAHSYAVSSCALVVGVLLPFAVRMYRRRLPLDDLPVWRNGIDDLRLLYLCTSILSAAEIFNYYVFTEGTVFYSALATLILCTALFLALLCVTESCVLGCGTRTQAIAAAVPLILLGINCPTWGVL